MKNKLLRIILSLIFVISIIFVTSCVSNLQAPTIVLNKNVITWNKIKNATSYEVTVGINKIIVNETSYTINVLEDGIYELSVKSIDSKNNYSSSSNRLVYNLKQNKTKLDTPVITRFENTIEWPIVNNCSKYEVSVNGKKETVTENFYSFTNVIVGTYKITVKACSANINYADSDVSNEIEIIVTEEVKPVKLDSPVISLNGNTITWNEITNSDRYFVYVNGELTKTTTLTSCDYNDGIYGNYDITVKAVSYNTTKYLASDESNIVSIYVPISNTTLNFSKPVCMFTINWKCFAVVNEQDSFVKGKSIEHYSEYQGISYQIIKDTDTNAYRIKLDNGKYLTWSKASDNDSDIFFADGLRSSGNTQLFFIEQVLNDGYSYKIYPAANPGYLLCENGINGYHQYMQMGEDGADKSQTWVIFNVDTIIGKDVIAKEKEYTYADLTKPVIMYTKSSNLMPKFNEKNILVKGSTYNSIIDYQEWAFMFIEENGYYRIKTNDGYYLEYVHENNTDKFIKACKSSSDTQLYLLNKINGYITIIPKTNQGYLVCEDDLSGYHLYNDCSVDSQKWMLVNVNATISDDNTSLGHECKHICSICGNCLDSNCQDSICSTKCNGHFDLTKPVVIYTKSTLLMPTFDSTNKMVKGSKYNVLNDNSNNAFLFIKVGSYYKIKYVDGYYLEYNKTAGKDVFSKNYKLDTQNQLFIVNQVDDYLKIEPLVNSGYLLCEDQSNGYYQYSDCNVDSQKWVYTNVSATFSEDKVKEESTTLDLTKPVIMYIKSSSKMIAYNSNNNLIKGSVYDKNNDNSEYAVIFIKVGNYYNIKTKDGYYLEYNHIGNNDTFKKACKSNNDNQLFIVEKVSDAYTIKPVTNAGYVFCEDDYSGYHLYSDCNVDSQRWILVNVNVIISDDK